MVKTETQNIATWFTRLPYCLVLNNVLILRADYLFLKTQKIQVRGVYSVACGKQSLIPAAATPPHTHRDRSSLAPVKGRLSSQELPKSIQQQTHFLCPKGTLGRYFFRLTMYPGRLGKRPSG